MSRIPIAPKLQVHLFTQFLVQGLGSKKVVREQRWDSTRTTMLGVELLNAKL